MATKRTRFFDNIKRSAVKSITFRCIIIISDTIIMFTITHRYDQTFWLVVVSNGISTLIYFLHERLWNHIHWGKSAK